MHTGTLSEMPVDSTSEELQLFAEEDELLTSITISGQQLVQ